MGTVLKKYPNLTFAKNGFGPATPFRVTTIAENNSENVIDHKLLDGKNTKL